MNNMGGPTLIKHTEIDENSDQKHSSIEAIFPLMHGRLGKVFVFLLDYAQLSMSERYTITNIVRAPNHFAVHQTTSPCTEPLRHAPNHFAVN